MEPEPEPDEPSPHPLVPEGFRFGVSTAGYAVEGGFNGPGEPRNNWFGWESSGRAEPSGVAVGFWDRYDEHLDRVAAIGCNAFRMSVEWARVEPAEGHVEPAVLDRYRDILGVCRASGIRPLVTLHHFTHPGWLGDDFWLRPGSPVRFARWVELAVEHLGDLCTDWVTIDQPESLAARSWLTGTFPPGRVGDLGAALTALDHMAAAHVLAYDALHRHQPAATVGTSASGTSGTSYYELGDLPFDLLAARRHGVDRPALGEWLGGRRRDHERAAGRTTAPLRRSSTHAARSVVRRLVAGTGSLDTLLPAATAAVYASPHDRLQDVAQLDWSTAGPVDRLRAPGRSASGGRRWRPTAAPWEVEPSPAAFEQACGRAAQPGLDLWVVANGMCNRVRNGRSHPRVDGWDRARYLREHLAAVVAAIERGAPVAGYWHRSLTDGYEWGSFEPRFGLHGVDRARGTIVTGSDAMGVDAAGTYRSLLAGLRHGDRSVIAEHG